MNLIKKLQQLPIVSKYFLNRYPPYRGAGIEIDQIDLANYHVRVKMPLTRKNQNIVGVHFGGSLYSMVDPFYMLILMHHLGSTYIVWDKAATIHFLAPGRSTVYADIRLSAEQCGGCLICHIDWQLYGRNVASGPRHWGPLQRSASPCSHTTSSPTIRTTCR